MTTKEVIPEEQEAIVEEEPKPQVTIEELQKQLTELQETSQRNEDNWKNEVRVKTKKDTEIQQLREKLSGNESQSDMIKALIAMMASQKNQLTDEFAEEVKAQQPDLMKQYEQIVEASAKKRQLDNMMSRIRTVQERTEALGLQGDDYDVVRAFAEAGQFDKAETRLDRLEAAKQTKPPEAPRESDDDRVERLAAERLKAELDRRGLLTQDTGSPSASATRYEELRDIYSSGLATPAQRDQYLRLRRERGI